MKISLKETEYQITSLRTKKSDIIRKIGEKMLIKLKHFHNAQVNVEYCLLINQDNLSADSRAQTNS